MNEAPLENGFFRWVRTLRVNRSEHGWMGGVASGIGARFGIDPILARGIMVVLALFGGIGIAAYGLAWALLPAHDGRIHLQEAARGRWASGMTGALIFFILGSIGQPWGVGDWGWNGGWGWIWPVLGIGLVLWIIFGRETSDDDGTGSADSRATRLKSAFGPQPFAAAPHSPEEANIMNNTDNNPPATGAGGTPEEGGPISLEKPAPGTAGFDQSYSAAYGTTTTGGFDPTYYVPEPPAPPTPRTPKARPLPGYQGAIVLGLAALVAGLILGLENLSVIELGSNTIAVALAAALLVIGIGVIGAAVRRRTGGVLIGLGIPVLVLSLIFGGTSLVIGGSDLRSNSGLFGFTGITDHTGSSYDFAFHSGNLDLTGYSTITEDTTLSVDNAFSNLNIAVPSTIPVRVETDGAFSNISLKSADGGGTTSSVTGQLNPGTTGPVLTLQIDGAFSNTTVTSQKAVVTP